MPVSGEAGRRALGPALRRLWGTKVGVTILAKAWRRALLHSARTFEERFGVEATVADLETAHADLVRAEERFSGPVRREPDPVLASGSRVLDQLREALRDVKLDSREQDALDRATARVRLEQGLPLSYRDVALLADVSDALVRLRTNEGSIERAGPGCVHAASARRWLVDRQAKR